MGKIAIIIMSLGVSTLSACGQKFQSQVGLASSSSLTVTAPAQSPAPASAAAPSPAPAPAPVSVTSYQATILPQGYLSTAGSQIVSASGTPVRIASVGYNEPSNVATDIPAMAKAGFNTLRYLWYDAVLSKQFAQMDQIVKVAGASGMKVIFDHHGNEATASCLGQQQNGLWFDLGAGSNGTDGCGAKGTITQATFQANWISIAKRYAGNSTVIGFDLTNEPLVLAGGTTWGGGGATDIRAMYQTVGNAILAVNPGILIICEGPQNWNGNFAKKSGVIAAEGDLTAVVNFPVVLSNSSKLVYSVHEYPTTISNINAVSVDSGADAVKRMNAVWGFIVSGGIAPVWVGEMGADLDGANGSQADEIAWVNTMLSYINGRDGALGGPTFSVAQQPISADWWSWGDLSGQEPDGTLTSDGSYRTVQREAWAQLLFYQPVVALSRVAISGLSAGDSVDCTLSFGCY